MFAQGLRFVPLDHIPQGSQDQTINSPLERGEPVSVVVDWAKDAAGNALVGDAAMEGVQRSYVRGESQSVILRLGCVCRPEGSGPGAARPGSGPLRALLRRG